MNHKPVVAAALLSSLSSLAVCTMVSIPPAVADQAGPAKTIPTLPTSTTTETAGPPATGIGIRAAASLPEFLPIANAVVGATGDVVGALATLARVPGGVPSPDGSTISEVSVDYNGLDEYYVATVRFTSNATADDAVTFYQATLTAAGFNPVTDSGSFDGEPAARRLRFAIPMSQLDDAAIDVAISETADIELTITDAIDGDVLNAFTGWAAGLPTLAEAEPIEATIRVIAGSDGSGLSMTLSTRFGYDDVTPEELAARVREGLPDAGFSLDTANNTGTDTTIMLHHVAMEDVTIEIGSGTSHPTTLMISGTVTL
jgi:hypothetical protein